MIVFLHFYCFPKLGMNSDEKRIFYGLTHVFCFL